MKANGFLITVQTDKLLLNENNLSPAVSDITKIGFRFKAYHEFLQFLRIIIVHSNT